MELSLAGSSIKEFSRCLSCLTRFGEDIDVSASAQHFKMSSINSSRSAFGVVDFDPDFFSRYDLLSAPGEHPHVSFCVTAKAFLAPLKARSAASIESCSISLTSDDPDRVIDDDGGGCRLVVRLHCQHGVIKTHRLTYGSSTSLYARANRGECTSFWVASSRVLKDWTDHFHLRTSSSSGGTEEISFYHGESSCRLKSFGDEQGGNDEALLSRPLATELLVEVDDFDRYEIEGEPLITFALKEFKAIITLADTVGAQLDVAFTTGGSPVLIETKGDQFSATFVIATTDFDSGSTPEASDAVKRAKSESRQPTTTTTTHKSASRPTTNVTASARNSTLKNVNAIAGPSNVRVEPSNAEKRPLFNPPSPSQRHLGGHDEFQFDPDEDDEFGADLELGEEDLAAIDRLSQMPPAGSSGAGSQRVLAPATRSSRATAGQCDEKSGAEEGGEIGPEDEDDEERAGAEGLPTQVGPTPQSPRLAKKPKWNLFPHDTMDTD